MKHKILLVEDEDMIREMYQMILTQNGYDVDTAADGETAVAKLTTGKPDYNLILLDIMLPQVDGISILKKMKAEGSPSKKIPVILLTNINFDDLVKEAMDLGADKYLVKSNTLPQQIIEEVNTFLKHHPSSK